MTSDKPQPESDKLGLLEVVSIGIGGMVGGGIFSVLGLSMHIAGHAVPITFAIGALIALLTAVSYAKLGLHYRSDGGSFTYLEHAFPNPNIAGIGGWLLVGGYVGTNALYAYTFGAYGAALLGQGEAVHKLLSMGVLLFFLVVNLTGVRASGLTEDLIVGIKMVILIAFGAIGLNTMKVDHLLPVFDHGYLSLLTASAVIFVAYEGFELIPNAVDEMEDPERDLPLGLVISVFVVSIIYILLSIVADGNLTADQVFQYKEYALAVAAQPSLGKIGFTIISIAAILSTASAINATLFGSARLATVMAKSKALPGVFSLRERKHGVPWFSLLSLAVSSALLAVSSSLTTISGVASGLFLLIFAFVNAAAVKLAPKINLRKRIAVSAFVLCLALLATLIMYTWIHSPITLVTTLGFVLVLVLLELLYSSRRIYFKE